MVVLDKDDQVGGLARTVNYKGFRFDLGGHRFFTRVEAVQAMWRSMLGPDLLTRPRLSRILHDGTFYDYPLRPLNALSGLGVRNAVLVAAILRRRRPPHRPGGGQRRTFVNNASMGLYARTCSRRSTATPRCARRRYPARPDGPAAVPLDLRFTLPREQATSANLVLVSNNPYQLSHLRGASTRPVLDSGRSVRCRCSVRGAADAEKFAALEPPARCRGSAGWNEWTATSSRCTSGGPVEVGVDGEALTMDSPRRFVIRPGAPDRAAATVPCSRATKPPPPCTSRPADVGGAVADRPRAGQSAAG